MGGVPSLMDLKDMIYDSFRGHTRGDVCEQRG